MPVRRYQNLDAAERDLWIDSSDPSLAMHIRWVWSFAEHFAPRAASGVTRIRTGERADGTLRDPRLGDAERKGGVE
jgi:hypothetical protein